MAGFDMVESRLDPGPHSPLLFGGQLTVSEPSTSDTSSGCSDHGCLAICTPTELCLPPDSPIPKLLETSVPRPLVLQESDLGPFLLPPVGSRLPSA